MRYLLIILFVGFNFAHSQVVNPVSDSTSCLNISYPPNKLQVLAFPLSIISNLKVVNAKVKLENIEHYSDSVIWIWIMPKSKNRIKRGYPEHLYFPICEKKDLYNLNLPKGEVSFTFILQKENGEQKFSNETAFIIKNRYRRKPLVLKVDFNK